MDNANPEPITILLIEDEALIRMATAAMLEDAGYRVVEAMNADEALVTLGEGQQIDIVITDVQMPGRLDGLELVEIITEKYPHILSLVTSGRASLREARDCGAKKFLTKPYTATAIQSAVEAVLAA